MTSKTSDDVKQQAQETENKADNLMQEADNKIDQLKGDDIKNQR
ncbi:hypothetical protein [Shigella sp. FC1967]|nr:hypothetical protein [Shigella sp. FC1967]